MSPRLPALSTRQLVAALKKAGFVEAPRRGKGSHVALQSVSGPRRLIIVPTRSSLPRGTIRAILRQADIDVTAFLALIGSS